MGRTFLRSTSISPEVLPCAACGHLHLQDLAGDYLRFCQRSGPVIVIKQLRCGFFFLFSGTSAHSKNFAFSARHWRNRLLRPRAPAIRGSPARPWAASLTCQPCLAAALLSHGSSCLFVPTCSPCGTCCLRSLRLCLMCAST